MDILVGCHAKDPITCKWVIENVDTNTENGTVRLWVEQSKQYLESLSDGGEPGSIFVE